MITLRSGSSGPEVAFLQYWLTALNPNPAPYTPARADSLVAQSAAPSQFPSAQTALASTGVFDSDTAAAVTRFQCQGTFLQAPPAIKTKNLGPWWQTALGTIDVTTWWQLAHEARQRYFTASDAPTTPRWLARLFSPLVSAPRGLDSARFLEGCTEAFGSIKNSTDGLQKLIAYINADAAVTDVRWAAYMLATVHRECGPSHGMLPVPEDGCDDNRRPVCTPLKNGNQRSYGDPVPCGPPDADSTRAASVSRLEAALEAAKPPQAPYKTGRAPDKKWTPKNCPAGKKFHTYYGRGYVQLTGIDNYRQMSAVTGQDLIHYPEKVLDPDTAYKIMSHGMRNGTFRHGHRLLGYIAGATCNYYDARNIINGAHDAASQVEDYAKRYEVVLYYSLNV